MSEEIEAAIIALAIKLKGDNDQIRVRKITKEGIEIYIIYPEGKNVKTP